MNIVLTCSECGYAQPSVSQKPLMNKIIMWNHVKKLHPFSADRIMRMYRTVPDNLYKIGRYTEAVSN